MLFLVGLLDLRLAVIKYDQAKARSTFRYNENTLNRSPQVNVSRMSLKLLRTQPLIVENLGITIAPLFLSLTS